MSYIKLPINQTLYQNVDDSSLSIRSPERHDVFMDESGSMVRRPGLENFRVVGTGPINGIFYWPSRDRVYICSATELYSMTKSGTVALIGSGLFNPSTRVIWDEAINPTRKMFGTNGGIPVEYDGATAKKAYRCSSATESHAPCHF
jgi:hypothetical protein